MAQLIKQANIWGRIGTGLGQGLSEQLPKDIEHYRRKSDLERFANEASGLSPIQQVARGSAIYNATPQMIESITQAAQLDNRRNAVANLASRGGTQGSRSSADVSGVQENKILDQAARANAPMQQQVIPSQQNGIRNLTQAAEAIRQGERPNQERPLPTIGNKNENPLNEQSISKLPWTREQKAASDYGYIQQGFTPQVASQLTEEDERTDLGTAAALSEQQNEIQKRSEAARKEFDRQLEQKLQKTKEGIFEDISGQMKSNLERGLMRDLRKNPKSSLEDVANDWSNRALALAKTQKKVDTLAATSGIETLWDRGETLKKLKEYSDIYARADNSEEFESKLGEKFGLSPQGRASIAYPIERNPAIKSYVSSYNPTVKTIASYLNPLKMGERSRKAAIDIENKISSGDSFLSIARALSEKDPFFDQRAFFDQLSEDKDSIPMNARQRDELAERTRDLLPNWGDLKILPWRSR